MAVSTEPRVCILQRYLPPDPSGAGKQAITLARALIDRGVETFLLGERPEDGPPDDESVVPAEWIAPAPSDPTRLDILAYWSRLVLALIRHRHRFDVLHVHAVTFLHSIAIPASRLLGKPVLVRSSLEGELPNPGSCVSDWLHYQCLGFASEFVMISRALEQEYLDGGIPHERLRYIPNGVDIGLYHPVEESEKKKLRRKLDLPVDARILTYHGVFVERKSIHWVLPILERELEESDLALLLVGGPGRDESETGYYSELRERIEGSPARDSIHVRGFRTDVHRFLQASDMYLLPSTGEGLPNALLEAMAVGLVPIVSRTSGSEEVIDHGSSGFLFDSRDQASFREAVDGAVSALSGSRGDRIGREAAHLIRKDFSIEAVTARYAERYRSLR